MRIKSMQLPMNKLGTKESELNYVLKPVKAGVISDKEVVNFCHSLTQVPRAYIKASMESIVQAVAHYLSLGYSVKFDELGTFYTTVDSEAVQDVADAGMAQLKNIYIRFRPSADLSDTVRSADINLEGVYKIVDFEKKIYEKVNPSTYVDSTNGGSGSDSGNNSGSGSNPGDNGDDLVG
jgi:predicted histone-like DNA-binding protein